MGGYDESYMEDDFKFTRVIDEDYWAVELLDFSAGNKVSPFYEDVVLIDSGSSLLYFP